MTDLENLTILIVDDDASMRILLRKILEKHDYKVVEAHDGEEALNFLKTDPEIALVITDIRMPKKDGICLLSEIVESYKEIKVILITAFGEIDQYLDAMNIGAFEYLNKPFKNQQLLDLVKRAAD
jgi:DNA-binding NtrC family response regulator